MFNIYFKEMKKFFSLIALVGVFAACEPENLQTAFNVADATATVNETVVCLAPDFDPSAVTVTYDWSVGGSTKSIKGNPAIEAGTVTVTATYAGATASTTVSYPKIFAGMDLVLTATVFLPYNAGGYIIDVEEGETTSETFVYGLQASEHGHGYQTPQTVTFKDNEYKVYMMQNATEFILEDSYSWETYEGFSIEDFELLNDDFAAPVAVAMSVIKEMEGIVPTENSYEFSVGAWSLYNVINPEIETSTEVFLVAIPEPGSNNPEIGPVASFNMYKISSACGVVEMAHPDHASHYHAGHGHYTHDGHALHGDNNNAGGGIIEAE